MELALHLGMTEGGLKNTMTQRELQRWATFAAHRMLPWRRVQMQLALIGMLIAQTMGGAKNAKLSDYTFDPPGEDIEDDEHENDPPPVKKESAGLTAADVAAQFGAAVYRKKA